MSKSLSLWRFLGFVMTCIKINHLLVVSRVTARRIPNGVSLLCFLCFSQPCLSPSSRNTFIGVVLLRVSSPVRLSGQLGNFYVHLRSTNHQSLIPSIRLAFRLVSVRDGAFFAFYLFLSAVHSHFGPLETCIRSRLCITSGWHYLSVSIHN